ncbi:RNA polymerase sigma factor [Algibacter lectus]|uniref:RNA polymerase sigma factor n=1 Tax=Algibacter lectus TaxID=221126 RepID=UPI0021CD8346|nr:sigma-70 family RNA polymerase sigma factor [Algibacter lectus]
MYSLHIDSLFSYGMRLKPDRDFVKDSIQDVFLDVYEHREKLSRPNNINFYLFRALKRNIFKKLKKERKTDDFSALSTMDFVTEYNVEHATIDKEIDKRNKKIITQVMKELTFKQQEILYLKFTKGFSYIEISEIIGIDHNSVRKQVYRAIKKIRENPVFNVHTNIIFFMLYPRLS